MSNNPITPRPQLGRAHPLKHALSRRQFLGTAAGAAGLALGSGLLIPGTARADDNLLPTPIPFSRTLFGYGPFHFAFPGPVDSPGPFCGKPGPFIPPLINNFNGFIGVSAGTGTATDGSGNIFTFDNRFMKGVYVGQDGKNHRGAFAFL
jgi:hypothetical protein